ncbi:uncharacterized protein BO87DRAFT_375880 [Aspergillus neoniger CBS 115656]|uniref:Uncharacterized protein n=1 Tax=Aspergillus neoniger (strain CBS 115656) TaxID=1448310 RepID=A0A318YMN3_ASPNB|nr:hypothetical protein BO87DRAFT_375880 [Aspergillus neoniger CBS 115656]PYH35077.1 hypothetical protein BO87DRAFT_375880 [Aspergillus neoniger CBS 115656]
MASQWYPVGHGMHHPNILEAELDESLIGLGTDCLDISTFTGRITAETPQAADKLYRTGKLSNSGLAIFSLCGTVNTVSEMDH